MLWKCNAFNALRNIDVEKSVIVKLKKGMLRWVGHVERMEGERLTQNIYMEEVSGERKCGKPIYGWIRLRYV